jgi:glycine/D-amino acid oxidase-like deaminating enzyme
LHSQNAIIGEHTDFSNLFLCNGFSGHGLQQSPAAGRGVAELIYHGAYTSLDLSKFGFDRIRNNQPFFEEGVV